MSPASRQTVLVATIVALAAVPAGLWFTLEPWPERFGTWFMTARSVGQLAGLIGLVTFSLSLILAVRLSAFDRWFGGLDRVYVMHRRLGEGSFWLLLAHPLALAVAYARFGPREAWSFLLPWSSVEETGGGFAGLALLALLIGLTLFARRLRYDWWKWTHRLMGVAFLVGFAHAMEIESDTTESLALKAYLAVLGAVGLAAWAYRSALWPWLRRWRYEVAEVSPAGARTWSVALRPRGAVMPFAAGQFAYLTFGGGVANEEHPFSMASGSADVLLRFGIKESGDWTAGIGRWPVGTPVRVEGPFGGFTPWRDHHRRQVWVAGGIGITPFLAALRGWPKDGPEPEIDLFYSVPDEASAAFLDELRVAKPVSGHFRLHLFRSKVEGWLTAERIKNELADFRERDYYLCGPSAMTTALCNQLTVQGVPEERLHFESFSLK